MGPPGRRCGPLPDRGTAPEQVVADLARDVEPYVTAHASSRFFGFVNVGYDSGIAICKHAAAHRSAMSTTASYLVQSEGETRDAMDWSPEFSRRARGVAVYATLRSLGREGVDDLVRRTHFLAQRFARKLEESGRVEIKNDVVFNPVLVRWLAPDGDHDAYNDRVMQCVQSSGEAYFSGTTASGMRMMRISVSDWATDEDDVDRAVDALLNCAG